MSKEFFFFATKTDMLNCLQNIEKIYNLKYVKCGLCDSVSYVEFNNGDKLPNIGMNTTGNHQSESYLVQVASLPILPRKIELTSGTVNFTVDQMLNKDSIIFWPSGIHDTNCIICGHVATVSSEKSSSELYKIFKRVFSKNSIKIERYYIGPEALLLSPGMRFITININQPVEYDLKIV